MRPAVVVEGGERTARVRRPPRGAATHRTVGEARPDKGGEGGDEQTPSPCTRCQGRCGACLRLRMGGARKVSHRRVSCQGQTIAWVLCFMIA